MSKHPYKCIIKEGYPWRYLITVYSCRDFYIKRLDVAPDRRARRVKRDYLQGCFPVWYKTCGLFHVEH